MATAETSEEASRRAAVSAPAERFSFLRRFLVSWPGPIESWDREAVFVVDFSADSGRGNLRATA
jgi:hypothetical protein